MNQLSIADTTIRRDADGRYSLNDLHRASGGKAKHRPSVWLANKQAQELVSEVELEAGIPALAKTRGGTRAGTYVAEQLVVAYAAWIDARFHLHVVNTFLQSQRAARVAAQLAPLDDPAALRGMLLFRTEQEIALRQKLDEQSTHVAAFDRLAEARGSVSITAAAKTLSIPPAAFFAWLQQNGWIYRSSEHGSWLAFQPRLDRGQLKHRVVTVERSDGTPRIVEQVLVTPKGLTRLAELLELAAPLARQSAAANTAKRAPRRTKGA
ncbi:phage antirepressor KilAC domain-containing protein [Luteimonas saliphila]|uniref:phage antirepressor KilAC domain-containing protein n=1 Tax=Luteimonas saliphila TaxID=2804919 RepID=UPI00192D37A7|nr:phage antirepressor KilAC domain-containing protein [Luteimonas saliphila]